MYFGILYEYRDAETGESAYVGKATAPYSIAQAIRNLRLRHLTVRRPIPFDKLLRANLAHFTFRVLAEVTAQTGYTVSALLDVMEPQAVRSLYPRHNVVRFASR